MKIPPPRKRIDIDEVLRLRKEEGLNAVQIAERMGFAVQSVRDAIHRGGGSLRPERSARTVRHGNRLRSLWWSVLGRCSNPEDKLYARYGAQGYSVCKEWQTFWPFYDWAIATGYRPHRIIEVLERSRTFSPRTCRFITVRQRIRRDGPLERTSAHPVTAFGETKAAGAWARDARCKVAVTTLRTRIQEGVPPEQAITLPPQQARQVPRGRRPARRGPRRQLLDWKEIERLHSEESVSIEEIARRLGASAPYLREVLKRRGLLRPRPSLDVGTLRLTFRRMRWRCAEERRSAGKGDSSRCARVCPEWSSYEAFRDWALCSGYEPGLCLTRRRGTRIYSPANCRWAKREEVTRANHARRDEPARRPLWTFEAFGERKGPAEWSRDPRCKVSQTGLLNRLRGGWRPEEALSTPPRFRGKSDAPEVMLTAFGQTKCLTDWSRDRCCKVSLPSLVRRLRRGVPAEEAITAPAYRACADGGGKSRGHAMPMARRRRRPRSHARA